MACKHVVFTVNNYTDEIYDSITSFDWEYIVVGKEVGESGTPHLQCYGVFHKKRNYKKLAKQWKAAFAVARGTPLEASTYCKKDGDFYEKGDLPASQAVAGGEATKEKWHTMNQLAKEGKFEELERDHPQEYARLYSTWHRMFQDNMPQPESRSELRNYWIYGATGCGKSRGVREWFGEENCYPKALNKWWDGYKNQRVVLIEEVSPKDKDWLAEKLKVWADHYPFVAEHKGKSVQIRPPIIVVTSNYSLSECFPEPQSQEPLARRFKSLHFITYNNLTGFFD